MASAVLEWLPRYTPSLHGAIAREGHVRPSGAVGYVESGFGYPDAAPGGYPGGEDRTDAHSRHRG